MQLIGMLDSPYVRRVAISLQLMHLDFEHRPLSVFRTFEQFSAINPVVKAPTLVCDDGTVLMDSTLILAYAEAISPARSLVPRTLDGLLHDLRITSLALAACEKSVQIIYEHDLRPTEKVHEPWIVRVSGQLLAALGALEAEFVLHKQPVTSSTITQGGISAAVTWHFAQQMIPDVVRSAHCPTIAAFSAQAETLPEFLAAPHGDGTVGR